MLLGLIRGGIEIDLFGIVFNSFGVELYTRFICFGTSEGGSRGLSNTI